MEKKLKTETEIVQTNRCHVIVGEVSSGDRRWEEFVEQLGFETILTHTL